MPVQLSAVFAIAAPTTSLRQPLQPESVNVANIATDRCAGLASEAQTQCQCVGRLTRGNCSWEHWNDGVFGACRLSAPAVWPAALRVSGEDAVTAFCATYAGALPVPPSPLPRPPPSLPPPYDAAHCATRDAPTCACCDAACSDCASGRYTCASNNLVGTCDCGYGAPGFDTYLATPGASLPALCSPAPAPPHPPSGDPSSKKWDFTSGVIAWWIGSYLLVAALLGGCVHHIWLRTQGVAPSKRAAKGGCVARMMCCFNPCSPCAWINWMAAITLITLGTLWAAGLVGEPSLSNLQNYCPVGRICRLPSTPSPQPHLQTRGK